MESNRTENQEGSFSFKDKRRSFGSDDSDSSKEQASDQAKKAENRKEKAHVFSDKTVNFSTFLISLASNVLSHLGTEQDPLSGKISLDLDLAKHSIDIISMLEEKTKGNLSSDEENLIKNILYELRIKFVEASNKGRGKA